MRSAYLFQSAISLRGLEMPGLLRLAAVTIALWATGPVIAASRIVSGTATLGFSEAFLVRINGVAEIRPTGTATSPSQGHFALPLAGNAQYPLLGWFDPGSPNFSVEVAGSGIIFESRRDLLYFDFLGFGFPSGFPGFGVVAGQLGRGGPPAADAPIQTLMYFPIGEVTRSGVGRQVTLGNINVSFFNPELIEQGVVGTLSTTFTVASVPEPQAWILLVAGFGLAAVALRRQPKRMLPAPTLTSTS